MCTEGVNWVANSLPMKCTSNVPHMRYALSVLGDIPYVMFYIGYINVEPKSQTKTNTLPPTHTELKRT